MPDKFLLEIATPDRLLLREEVDQLQVPAVDGYLGVLAGHAPLLTELGAGVLRFRQGSRDGYIALQGGVMETLPERTRIAAADAEWANNVDVERARRELSRAMNALQDRAIDSEVEQAQVALARAKSRLEAHERSTHQSDER